MWFAVARWLELLPYWVGTIGVLFVLLGSGAYKPLLRLMGSDPNSKRKRKTPRVEQPKPAQRVTLGIREARDEDSTPEAPVELPEEEPLPAPLPAEPEKVGEEQAENFQQLQARLAAARERRASGEPPTESRKTDTGIFDSGPDLQAQILQVAKERDEEQRTARQRRKAERQAARVRTERQQSLKAQLEAAQAEEAAQRAEEPAAELDARPTAQGAELPAEALIQRDAVLDSGVELTDLADLAERIELLRDSLERGNPAERERSEFDLRGLLVALRSTVGALELLSHAAPYLGPQTPLDPEQELQLETALDRLRGD